MATPRAGADDDIAVAVVRWFGGNHRADNNGGADMSTGPPMATRN